MRFVQSRGSRTKAIERPPKTMMRTRPRSQSTNQAIRRRLQSIVRRPAPPKRVDGFCLCPPSANLLVRSRTSGGEYVTLTRGPVTHLVRVKKGSPTPAAFDAVQRLSGSEGLGEIYGGGGVRPSRPVHGSMTRF